MCKPLGILGMALTMAALSPASAQKDLPLPLPIHLTGDGHACSGYLHITRHMLVWKSSFSTCRASGYRAIKDGDQWDIVLEQTAAEKKSCSMHAIAIRANGGISKYSPYEVAGFASLQVLQQHTAPAILDCPSLQ